MQNSKKITFAILITMFIIPLSVMASAQTANEDNAGVAVPGDIIPAGPAGPVAIANELQQGLLPMGWH